MVETAGQGRAQRAPIGQCEALIFFTGAVTLSLEVLASRVMTPYFGVSLYIWAAILSITLAFLAAGYYLGGRLSQRYQGADLMALFLTAPAGSALSIALACVLYPVLFPMISAVDLVFGSFVAGFVLLALPLTALSAMNPMLIALGRDRRARGDGGAGRVFFISTIGSVAGVLATAFLFIPNVSNYRAMLSLGLALCAAALLLSIGPAAPSRAGRRRIFGLCIVAAVLCGGLLVGQQRYLAALADYYTPDAAFEVLAEYGSVFGNVKVVELRPRAGDNPPVLVYVQDGLVQNRAMADGTSLSSFTHVLERLARAYRPKARTALVLGLGAGIVARDLRAAGLEIDAVEINPDALVAAQRFFHFDPAGITIHVADARTFVRRCRRRYDIAVLDLFQGDSTPDYLLTAEFFRDVRNCLGPSGALVMNAFFDASDPRPNQRLLATVAASFPAVVVYHLPQANAFVVATGGRAIEEIELAEPNRIPRHLRREVALTLAAGRLVGRWELLGIAPVTDNHNVFSVLYAAAEMRLRRHLTTLFPPHILVN